MSTGAVTSLRLRMIEDMNARKLGAGTQRGHIHSCKQFCRVSQSIPPMRRRPRISVASNCTWPRPA
jgi:hypothetical protein